MEREINVIAFGFSEEECVRIEKELPSDKYRLIDTDVATDLIALPAAALIVRSSRLNPDDYEMIASFYKELDGCFDEAVIWIGDNMPGVELERYFKCYVTLNDALDELKYIILDASKHRKKSQEFSNKICTTLKILLCIKRAHGISTKELANICEISSRSVLRYIETLRCIGELITYNTKLKGWELIDGYSILLDD